MAFTKKEKDLKSMVLCGNSLPWVKSTRHLGNKIEDKIDGTRQDMREKRSQFIQKNNEICQEFSFADSTTKIRLNNIFNTHFTGSPIWDLFCGEADAIEKTWNVAMRKTMKLNRCSHISNRTTFTNTPYQILPNEKLHQFYTEDPKLHKNILRPYTTVVLKKIVNR